MKKFILAATTALAMGAMTFGSTASAAPNQYNRGHDRPAMQQNNHGYFQMNGQRFERQRGPAWQAPRGYHQQSWKRGQRLPSDYRRVEVRDYRAYHLSAPPRGYHYVRVGNDVVLTSIASGVIAAVIANAFFN